MQQAPVSTAVLVICVIIYFLEQSKGGAQKTATALKFGALYTPYVRKGQYWRLITACFVHFGAVHIIANMYSLYMLGPSLERAVGSVRFAVIYLGAGVAGNLLTCATEKNKQRPPVSAGASGAIFGLMGAWLVLSLAVPGWSHSVRALLFTLAINLVYGAFNRGINMRAHVGGLLGGAALTFLLLIPYLHQGY